MQLGIVLAILAALFSSMKGAFRKHVARDFSSVEIGFLGQVYGAILLLPFAAFRFSQASINLTPGVLAALSVSTLVVLASTYLYIESLRVTDISVAEPLRNTSPIFVALLEPLVLNISFKMVTLLAALMGSAGAYILVSKNSVLKPLENLENKGAFLAVIVAFILALYSIAQRFGATNTDPLLFIYLTYVAGLIGFWIWMRKESGKMDLENYLRRDVFALGSVTALGVVAGIYSYSMISASEVAIIKQLSAVFGVLIGGRFFREEDLWRKMVGAVIVIAGVFLLI